MTEKSLYESLRDPELNEVSYKNTEDGMKRDGRFEGRNMLDLAGSIHDERELRREGAGTGAFDVDSPILLVSLKH